ILTTALPHIDALLNTPGADRSSVLHNLLLMASHQGAVGDYETFAEFLTPGAIAQAISAVQDPVLFAELQLLAAGRSSRVSVLEASRGHLDQRLGAAFSLVAPFRFEVARLLVRIIAQLLETHHAARLLRLPAAADPLPGPIPPNSPLCLEFLQLRA